MPVGPQRSGNPNIVVTPHGQQLSRKSDTAYTHAVVHTEPMEERRGRIQQNLEAHQGIADKYGAEAHVTKTIGKLTKELGSLPADQSHWSEIVSMHVGSSQAKERAAREGRKTMMGSRYTVLPVSQQPPG